MIEKLIVGGRYSRKQLWRFLHPNDEYPVGGNWSTGYVRESIGLLVFANVGVSGRTGHDFPNRYDAEKNLLVWFGKPNAHSAQPTFRDVFSGVLKLFIFVRWDNSETEFTYLGVPTISSFEDGFKLSPDSFTLKMNLVFEEPLSDDPGPEGAGSLYLEGGRKTVSVNRYERDPSLRAMCIDHFGAQCQVCGFDFKKTYGDIGSGYCQVHHLRPLSEVGSEHFVDPHKDLIPVCANCHAMLHRVNPALTLSELKGFIKLASGKDS